MSKTTTDIQSTNEAVERIVLALANNPGVRVRPKGDGRVEVPRNIVRIMDWSDGQRIWIRSWDGSLILSEDSMTSKEAWLVGGTDVSMGRVRIPLFALKKSGLNGLDLVVVAENNRVTARSDMKAFEKQLRVIFGMIGRLLPKDLPMDVVADIITGNQSVRTVVAAVKKLCPMKDGKPASEDVIFTLSAIMAEDPLTSDPDPEPEPSEVLKIEIKSEVGETEWVPEEPPDFLLPDPSRPVVMRIIGNPYQFHAHWMRVSKKKDDAIKSWPGSAGLVDRHTKHKNELALCGPLCTMCERRKPDKMWLVPVLAVEAGVRNAGFLMVQTEVIRKIARTLRDKDRDRTDIILYHRPWSEGMCEVFANPPEDLIPGEIEKGRATCSAPDKFLAYSFREAKHVGGDPIRPPMMITGHHLEWVPVSMIPKPKKVEAYTEETDLDRIVDALEMGTL